MKKALTLLAVGALAAACSTPESKPAAEPPPGPIPAVQRTSIGDLPDVDVDVDSEKAKITVPDVDVDVPQENEKTIDASQPDKESN